MTEATEPEVVNSEPKVFVGQLPEHTQESAIKQLFSTYGNVKSLSLPRYPNSGDIRRFAIVRFDRWAAAEQAVDDVHGTLKLGGDKPLVVRFADPPKVSAPGSAQSKGIAPRKLFVGQIPRDCPEAHIRSLFEPFGEITHFAVRRSERAATIAFVQFSTWLAAEEAMEALNGSTDLPGQQHPLVVHFADGKAKTTATDALGQVGAKRTLGGLGGGVSLPVEKRMLVEVGAKRTLGGLGGGGVSLPVLKRMPIEGMDGMNGLGNARGMAGVRGMGGMGAMNGMGGGMGGMNGVGGGMSGMNGVGGMGGMDRMGGMVGMNSLGGMGAMNGMGFMIGVNGMGGMGAENGMGGMDRMHGMRGLGRNNGMGNMRGSGNGDGIGGMDGMQRMNDMTGMDGRRGMGGRGRQGLERDMRHPAEMSMQHIGGGMGAMDGMGGYGRGNGMGATDGGYRMMGGNGAGEMDGMEGLGRMGRANRMRARGDKGSAMAEMSGFGDGIGAYAQGGVGNGIDMRPESGGMGLHAADIDLMGAGMAARLGDGMEAAGPRAQDRGLVQGLAVGMGAAFESVRDGGGACMLDDLHSIDGFMGWGMGGGYGAEERRGFAGRGGVQRGFLGGRGSGPRGMGSAGSYGMANGLEQAQKGPGEMRGGCLSTEALKNCPWKLFVGQLPYEANEVDLTSFFEQFGEVVCANVLRKSDGTNRSRGCGFVTFAHREEAQAAIAAVNMQLSLPGSQHPRHLIVHFAK